MPKLKSYKKLLSPEQIAGKKSEIEHFVRLLEDREVETDDGVGYFRHSSSRIMNPADIKKQIALRKRELEKGTPVRLTGHKADKAFKVVKKLDKWIEDNIPKDVYIKYPKEQGDGFDRSVRAQMNWDKKRVALFPGYYPMHPVEARDYLMRRIDPDAPRRDFEGLRRER